MIVTTDLQLHYNTMRYESQENVMYIAIHPTTYRGGGFLAHGVLKASEHISGVCSSTYLSAPPLCFTASKHISGV